MCWARAKSYEELKQLAAKANLGNDLVVQTPYGDSGRTTFFVSGEGDWKKNADVLAKEELKVMKRINHLPGTVEGVATRHGTLVGPVHDRYHRLRRADALQGRLVRQ